MRNIMREYSEGSIWICVACVISNIADYPAMVVTGWGRMFAIAFWILLMISLIFKGIGSYSNTYFCTHLVLYALFFFNTAITGIANDLNAFGNHFFRAVTIPTVVLIVAMRYGYDFNSKDLKRVCIWYYITTSIMSFPLLLFYLRYSDLSTSVYDYDYGKNEIAILLLFSLIIGTILYEPDNVFTKWFKYISLLFIIVDILYLRCRSSFLGVAFLFGTLSIYSNKMTQKHRIAVILGLLTVTVYFLANPDSFDTFLNQIVYAGRDGSNFSEVSSGRDADIKLGFELFSKAPFCGVGHAGTTIDCFFASAVANYGLLAWPLITMALLPVIWSCINLKNGKKEDLCFFIIAFSMFFVSLCEEQAPFGPGVRCYFLWLMWGILLQVNDRNRMVQIVFKR